MKQLLFIIILAIAFVLFKEGNAIAFGLVCSFIVSILLLLLISKFQKK